jgi:peptidoglycan/xylan/chitin deacetylase (PgdA/CDA1 family)
MSIFMTVIGALAVAYAVWRLRHGYPRRDAPRALCFHKLSRRFCWEGTWTTPARFARALDHLRESGWRFLSEAEYLSALEVPSEQWARAVFVTFDDAYASVYEEAFPILRERAIPFHLFVVSDYAGKVNDWDLGLGRPPHRHATWDELREMVAAGATVGSHGASHADLTSLDGPGLRDELVRSRERIASSLGVAVRTFSYPFGRSNARVRAAAREAGYAAAFSLYPRGRSDRVDRYALRRDAVYIIDPAGSVETKLRPGPLFWLEDTKCRAINAVAVLTPLLKRRPPAPDRARRNGGGSTSAR